jgi:heptosyltransferase-1
MIGDIIMSTPVVVALKHGIENSFIGYVVEKKYAELVDELPEIDRIHPFDRGKPFELLREIRKEKYDVVIDLHSIPKTAVISALSGAKLTIGFNYPYRRFLYSKQVKLPDVPFSIHSVENMMKPANLLGVFNHPGRVIMKSKGAISAIDNLISREDLEDKKMVIIHIAPSNEFKRWSAENYALLAEELFERGLFPIFVGGNDDIAYSMKIVESLSCGALSLVGKLGLKELRELISRASLYVGVDSGPAHIAATTNIPIVVLFGPTTPKVFGPYTSKLYPISLGMKCSPCRQKKCIHGDIRCMKIPVSLVLECVDRNILSSLM